MVAIAKKELKIEKSLYEIMQIISVSVFDKTQLNQLLSDYDETISDESISIQLILFYLPPDVSVLLFKNID